MTPHEQQPSASTHLGRGWRGPAKLDYQYMLIVYHPEGDSRFRFLSKKDAIETFKRRGERDATLFQIKPWKAILSSFPD